MAQQPKFLTRPFNGLAIPLPGTYDIDPVHTFILFSVQHLAVGRVRGRFTSFQGRMTVEDEPLQSSLDVTIDTKSIDTGVAKRDEDLRSEGYFDVEKFPTMTYRGTGMITEPDGYWTVHGNLTIRNVTRPVALTGAFVGAIIDPWEKTRIAGRAQAKISRRDFQLTFDLDSESGGFVVGNDVHIEINAEATLES